MLVFTTSSADVVEKHFIKRNALLNKLGINALENSVLGQSSYQSAPSGLVQSAIASIAGSGPVNVLGHEIQATFTRHLGIPNTHLGVPVENKNLFKVIN